MDKNHIKGRRMAMRRHNTPKSTGMPAEVNVAAVQQSNVSLPGELSSLKSDEKSAEAIVAQEDELECEEAHRKMPKTGLERRAEPMRRDSTS